MANLGDVKKDKMEAAQRNMKRRMQEWINASLIMGWGGWVKYVKQVKEDRQKITRFLAKLRMAGVVKVRARARAMVLLRGPRLTLRLAQVFAAWKGWSTESRRSEIIVTRLRAKMQNSGLVRCLLSWAGYAKEEKENRVKLARFAMRLKNGCLIGAFSGWQEFVALRLRLRFLALKTFNRLANAQTFGAWEVWMGLVEEGREKERKEHELQFLTGKEREDELARLAEAEKKKQKVRRAKRGHFYLAPGERSDLSLSP
jgi:hypothetical protein